MSYYKAASLEETKVINDTLMDNWTSKAASISLDSFTRDRLRENSFAEKIITPQTIGNNDFDKTENPKYQVKWIDREPDTAASYSIPYGNAPKGMTMNHQRYPLKFGRLATPKHTADIGELRGMDLDIRQILLEHDVKELATVVDTRFLEACDSVIGAVNTSNIALSGMPRIQNVLMPGGFTRTNIKNAFKYMYKLRVPFSPMCPDGSGANGVILLNNSTAADLLDMDRNIVGGDQSQKYWLEGELKHDIFGVKPVYTIKDELVPDGVVYLFSSEDFLGKYGRLQELTVWHKQEAYFLEFFQYMEIGIAIGNCRGIVKIDFNG